MVRTMCIRLQAETQAGFLGVCMCMCVCQSVCSFNSGVCSHRSRYGQGNLEGNHYKIHANGTLEIKRIRTEDQGTYLCVVSNVAGREESQVRVEVKGRTWIVPK